MITEDTKTIKVLKRINAALQVKVDAYRQAAAAREQRQAKCAYCRDESDEGGNKFLSGSTHGDIAVIEEGRLVIRDRTHCAEEIFCKKTIYEIELCPMCGRNLRMEGAK